MIRCSLPTRSLHCNRSYVVSWSAAVFLLALTWVSGLQAGDTAAADASTSGTQAAHTATTFTTGTVPDGLSLVALIDDQWQVLVAEAGAFIAIPGIDFPRSVAYHHEGRRVAWVGADNKLRERDLSSGSTTLLGPDDGIVRYTQPGYTADGKQLIAVELPDGRSRSTRIVAFKLQSGERDYLVRKRTAQFEPHLAGDRLLHYTTAICVDDCIGMIWELWQRDLQSARHEQLTLLNAVSKTPRLAGDNWLYFTSDAAGEGFHIWRMRPEPGSRTERLTRGDVRDSDPAPAADGSVYFIRHSRDGSRLMRLVPGAEPEMIALDSRISDLRNLELAP